MMRKLVVLCFLAVVFGGCRSASEMDLAGEWSFALDPDDVGVTEQWYKRALTDAIRLPGSLQEQGYGDDVTTATRWTGTVVDSAWYKQPQYAEYRQPGNVKISFWLQPDKHYAGVAWYQRKVTIPSSWKGRYVELELERAHWGVTLYVNGTETGSSSTLLTPCRFPVTAVGEVTLTLRVDNRMLVDLGVDAHSVSDQTQSNWNGIIGHITLSERPLMHIDAVRVFPDIHSRKARVEIDLAGDSSHNASVMLRTEAFNCRKPHRVKPVTAAVQAGVHSLSMEVDMGREMLVWSEFEPNLYRMEVELRSKLGSERRSVEFGMREFKAEGSRFAVNGTPIFLRGTLECAIFPLTGYPPTDTAAWGRIYRRCKEYGLNHVRFHSWCPPEAAFAMADREGVYLQVECGAWATVGDGGAQDSWILDESERIVREYGNHPSFCMMPYGNEPFGAHQNEYLRRFVEHWKEKDKRRVYTAASGWPHLSVADYNVYPFPRIYTSEKTNILNVHAPFTDYDWRDRIADRQTIPVVSHEIGQWCAFPNLKEISKFTGVLKAKNFEIFKETLNEHHLGDMADRFLYASGRLQTLCYKADIEAALRTPGFAGFQLLDLHDFPGQGTALVGVLDAFWDSKGYTDGEEYRSFCNRTVPLARMPRLIYTNADTLEASLEIAHFDTAPLSDATVHWRLTDALDNVLIEDSTAQDLPIANCIPVARISCPLTSVKTASQLTLTVEVPAVGAANRWHIWVYPSEKFVPQPLVTFTANLKEAVSKAHEGANVLCYLPKSALKPDRGGDLTVGFTPIFWNTAWFPSQAIHTLGICCNPYQAMLLSFPNKGYSDYQWWDVLQDASAIVMDDLPADLRPLIYVIDDWFTNRKLGLVFECTTGKGKILVCGANIASDLDSRPAARQFRRSLEQYMASDKFKPTTELDEKALEGLLRE